MFTTLLHKEIRETVLTGRFVMAALMCLILIPLGIYVTNEEYRQHAADFSQNVQLYHDRLKDSIDPETTFECYRPPSPLSVFAFGLEPFLPTKVELGRDRRNSETTLRVLNESGITNPSSLLFGKIDFLFTTSFVLSLIALILTFGAVTSEKEQGTLRLVIANPVPRYLILTAKIFGNFIVFLVPFCVALLTGFFLLVISGSDLLTASAVPNTLFIVAVTIAFIFSQFCLGMLISSFHKNSLTAMVAALFVWVMFTFVIPKMSPMIAQIVHPVSSPQVITNRITTVTGSIRQELYARESELFGTILARHGYRDTDYFGVLKDENKRSERKSIEIEYDVAIAPVREEYIARIAREIDNIQTDYSNRKSHQSAIAMTLSRISPSGCYIFLVTELAGTGVHEIDNFNTYVRRFRDTMQREVYDRFTFRKYGTTKEGFNQGFWIKDEYKNKPWPEAPDINGYRPLLFSTLLRSEWRDILLLGLYTALFFAAAFVRFLRYDVR